MTQPASDFYLFIYFSLLYNRNNFVNHREHQMMTEKRPIQTEARCDGRRFMVMADGSQTDDLKGQDFPLSGLQIKCKKNIFYSKQGHLFLFTYTSTLIYEDTRPHGWTRSHLPLKKTRKFSLSKFLGDAVCHVAVASPPQCGSDSQMSSNFSSLLWQELITVILL